MSIKHNKPSSEPYAAVDCRLHGTVDIDHAEYMRPLSMPNSKWKCPRCGADAQFNDERYEELNPQPED